jgi:hypothetical protein
MQLSCTNRNSEAGTSSDGSETGGVSEDASGASDTLLLDDGL